MPGKGIEYALLNKNIDLITFVKRLHRIVTEKERRSVICLLLTEICYNSSVQIQKMVWKGYLYQHANTTWSKFRTLIIKLKAAKRCFQTSKVNTTCKLCII